MYGFWSDGFRPRPSRGAACSANGLATKTRSTVKNVATAARIGTVHGSTSRVRRPFRATAAALSVRSTRSQREERALLSAPEGRQRVAQRQLTARVLGDVGEREVSCGQGAEEDD